MYIYVYIYTYIERERQRYLTDCNDRMCLIQNPTRDIRASWPSNGCPGLQSMLHCLVHIYACINIHIYIYIYILCMLSFDIINIYIYTYIHIHTNYSNSMSHICLTQNQTRGISNGCSLRRWHFPKARHLISGMLQRIVIIPVDFSLELSSGCSLASSN